MRTSWYLSGIAAGVTVGWLATQCHLQGWGGVGLVSLGAGVLLGWAAGWLAGYWNLCRGRVGRRTLVVGALLFAATAVFAEHSWLYADFRRQWTAAQVADPRVALFRASAPWTPGEYLRHEVTTGRLLLWSVDAALLTAGTLAIVLLRCSHAEPNSTAAEPSMPKGEPN